MNKETLVEGLVISAHGRQYHINTEDEHLIAYPRGKKSDLAVGDRVIVRRLESSQGVIESILPRTSLLYRSDAFRQKLIAANVTQVLIVVATEPSFSDELITRALVAAESEGLRAMIVLNKSDIDAQLAEAEARLKLFESLGYPVLPLCAHQDTTPLIPWLSHEATVLIGQSGMGKSTIINGLIPEALAKTREISSALDSGKHTTTHATCYALPFGGTLIDSPGLQAFGLSHLTRDRLEAAFPEFKPFLGVCRFRNCAHHREPGCAVREALECGRIETRRFLVFQKLCQDISR